MNIIKVKIQVNKYLLKWATIYFIAILLIFSFNSFCQTTQAVDSTVLSSQQTRQIKHKTNELSIQISPFSLTLARARFRFGLEYYSRHIAISTDIETAGDKTLSLNENNRYAHFFGIRPEIKIYKLFSKNRSTRNHFYYGLEFSYNKWKRRFESIYFQSGNERWHADSAEQQIKRIGWIWKLGYNIRVTERFNIDLDLGIGSGNRKVKYINTVNQVSTLEKETSEWGSSSDQFPQGEQKVILPDFGFRLRYVFFK